MDKKNNQYLTLCIILSAIVLLLGGFVVYDKVLRKDEGTNTIGQKSSDCPKCIECEKCEKNGITDPCDCSNSNLGEKVNSVKKIEITKSNQKFKVGNKEVKLRIGNDEENNEVLFVNDYAATYNFSGSSVKFLSAYLTDKFIFFTTGGNSDGAICYAINEDGWEIPTNYNGYFVYDSKKFRIVDGYLHANGSKFCYDSEVEECKSEEYKTRDLLIKYIDNTLIVTEAK